MVTHEMTAHWTNGLSVCGINGWNPGEARNFVDVYTDGPCNNNGYDDASARAGIFSANDNTVTCAIRIPKELKQTNQTSRWPHMPTKKMGG
ncbi:hypothetical protein DFJ43DRAFT_1060183 [Lentinula guzmanii]|uniref:Uncharacterized protein n=1 Tax=Lentinula guzmanii TaxID=2804957 RepID=A0AA38N3I7_9AGAR|nr:hypothetical protein DFJ43DRAFT_1060183 [Lentinula guzmanii]